MRLAAAAAAPALIFALGAGASAAPHGGGARATGTVTSAYVAGYAAVTKSGGVASFASAQATFTVPALNCTSVTSGVFHAAFLADKTANPWLNASRVGGVQELCQGGTASYHALSIDYCNSSAPQMPVRPGDTVKVTVTPDAAAVDDLTTGKVLDNSSGPSCGTHAVAGAVTAEEGSVADFTQIGFRQIQVQGTGQATPHPLAYAGWNVTTYILKGASGRDDVKPEVLLSGKYTSAFANDWYFAN
jgi:hypothetical protein